jgi:hypothetical protein
LVSSSTASIATRSTCARPGPRRDHSISFSTLDVSPCTTASTVPSLRLRAHPVIPSWLACCRMDSRKKTPWTWPWMRRWRVIFKAVNIVNVVNVVNLKTAGQSRCCDIHDIHDIYGSFGRSGLSLHLHSRLRATIGRQQENSRTFSARRQHHALRFTEAHLARLQVRHHDRQASDQRSRIVR